MSALAANLAPQTKPRILCVDDEPQLLQGLGLHLGRRYEVLTATSGPVGLELLRADPRICVVMSDMRMPGMDGATFLREARALRPDATRLLLTGQADLESAVLAVNDGQLFRFLTKPVLPPILQSVMASAVEQHRLLTAEKELLEQTLRSTLKTVVDVLALASPVGFGRANRVKQLVTALAEMVGLEERWQVEIAALLSQLGEITLPPDVQEKLHSGKPLTDAEKAMAAKVPQATEQFLAPIPRIEVVREMLQQSAAAIRKAAAPNEEPRARLVRRGAELLAIAKDFDVLEGEGHLGARAIDVLESRVGRYDAQALVALRELRGQQAPRNEVRELSVNQLKAGMVLMDEVRLVSGVLLVPRGFQVTEGLVARVKNFDPASVRGVIRVLVPRGV